MLSGVNLVKISGVVLRRLCFVLCFMQIMDVSVSAQDAVYSQPYEQLLVLNPAFAGARGYGSVSVFHRSQWLQLTNPFRYYGISASLPVERIHGAAGFTVVREDYAGLFSVTRAECIYSYEAVISSALSAGFAIQAGAIQSGYTLSNLLFPGQIDPATLTTLPGNETGLPPSKIVPDFATGFAGVYRSLYFGASAHHLTRPLLAGGYRIPLRITAHAGYNFEIARSLLSMQPLSISPNITFWHQGDLTLIQTGSYLSVKPLYAGIWARSNTSFSWVTMVVLAGITAGRLQVAISYDADALSASRLPGKGSWEATCSLKVDQIKKRKTIRAIKCPKI